MNILSVSDTVVPYIYSPAIKKKYGCVDFVIACGDLPYYYQEFIISMLNVPLYFVHGNHDSEIEYGEFGERRYPHGGTNLHRRVIYRRGALIAGIEGSIRYKPQGKFQYSQRQMWLYVMQLIPSFFYNNLHYGRYLDIFVSHAPPWGIHDQPDLPHQGIKAFRWLIDVFKPRYHFHGHIHVYNPSTVTETLFGETRVINTYGCRQTELDLSRICGD
ncbi:MAG: metallophosphoesterase [Chloroflexota bacterium]|nr:metallophosphoesterase [Chloroflexota bacterium]